MTDIEHCIICNGDSFNPMYCVPDRHYGIKGKYSISKCNNCGLVFLNPMPDEHELNSFYPKESYYSYYVSYNKENPVKKVISTILCVRNDTKDNKLLALKTKSLGDYKPKMLDIGCGNGWFIKQQQEKGWDIYGVEPSQIAVEVGRRAGLNIHHGDLLSANFETASFDYIRSNHSFEHIYNPDKVLQEIYRILKPEGRLFIGVPNINSFNAMLFKQYWYYLGAPVHTYNYSNKTLTVLLEKYGFIVEKMMYNSCYMGLLGSFQIFLNRKTGKTSEQGFFVNFLPLKSIAGVFSKLLNILHAGDCIEVIAMKK